MSVMRVIVLSLFTKFEVRQLSLSKDMSDIGHGVMQPRDLDL